MSNAQRSTRDGDLTDDQAAVLLRSFTEIITEAGDIANMLSKYVQAGGRDWETFERLLDHWARQGMKMVFTGRGALRPELAALSEHRIAEASGEPDDETDLRAHLHRKLAAAVLSMVWFAGEHHLVEPEDWPEDLAVSVLKAVRRAPHINNDPMMDYL